MGATEGAKENGAAASGTMKLVRRASGVVAAVGLALAMAGTANANLLTNGGFESGDLTGWTNLGNTVFDGVECPGPGFVFQGSCDFFGGSTSTSTLSQTFATVIGGNYVVTFAVDPDGGTPSSFLATFGGVSLFSTSNAAEAPYALHRVLATATSALTTIAFTTSNPTGFTRLDAVSVDVPEPAPMALLGLGLAGLWFGKRRKS